MLSQSPRSYIRPSLLMNNWSFGQRVQALTIPFRTLSRIVLTSTVLFASHAAENSSDAQLKAIYSKEWAWRQAQRCEDDEDSAGSRRVVTSQLPRVDAKTQAVRLAYWTEV